MKKIVIMIAFFATAQLFWGALLYADEGPAGMMQSVYRTSDLVGKTVETHNQVKLGVVKDLVIGPDGRVNYVVVSHDEMQKMGAKLTPIPFSAIDKVASGAGKIIINVKEKEFLSAPAFAENQWPDFSKPPYGEKLHGYYESTPMEKKMEKAGVDQREIPLTPFFTPY